MPSAPRATAAPLLDEDLCAFVRSGVSVGVATRDAAMRPHVTRVVGTRHDGERVVVLLPRAQALDVIADVEANGRIAMVITQPSTHRTYQFKASDARIVPSEHDARECAEAYRDAFARELQLVGWPHAYTEALLEGIDDELVCIAFTPEAAFLGTPGPKAGDAIDPAR
jgi:hypothetical protein